MTPEIRLPQFPPEPDCDLRFLQEPKRRRLGSAGTSSTGYPLSPESPSLRSVQSVIEPEIIEWWYPPMLDDDSPYLFALQELKNYIHDWKSSFRDDFWHRKSGKSVLSVIVCRGSDGGLAVHRGMNTEVSLPAGSFCAERAAIARAASDFHEASSLLAIATVDPHDKLNPLWPCEVCQSWLAKLRAKCPGIAILAFESSSCDAFAIRVNSELLQPPAMMLPPSLGLQVTWKEQVELAEGTKEWPWEAKELVYVDGAWTFLHNAQQNILKQARSRGTHLLVGVHSDKTLRQEFDGPIFENFATRVGRVLQNRHVCSVLKDAPWTLVHEMISTLGIRRVITGSVCKARDVGKEQGSSDPYKVARTLGILEVIPSLDAATERSVFEAQMSQLGSSHCPERN